MYVYESNLDIICFVFFFSWGKKDNVIMYMYIYGYDVFDFYLIKGILLVYFGMSLCYILVLV